MNVQQKIVTLEEAAKLSAEWQAKGQKVVFTNGCFDLLHAGHITYLSEAAALGNKLIIGLNSDSSVKRLKGENRPINDEKTRSLLLAAMYFVDAVILFEEETPLNLIKQTLPNILVKGGDYTIDTIVGAKEVLENNGSVKTITFLPGYSSTSIINKIRNF
ncbi:D-glycero-beta-D-manno-heptose 1-phosphate adenylyltransferase [Pseudopedobacter beijingensis]|uniref:D-glycero-beta-D-manno-heptose 1-phosphate adenylyltransferase n=1 Tax=Pseudopedobacter beijingensis TaxID=1207056 RepID=A0ABW4IEI7_9SPHI